MDLVAAECVIQKHHPEWSNVSAYLLSTPSLWFSSSVVPPAEEDGKYGGKDGKMDLKKGRCLACARKSVDVLRGIGI